MKEVITYQAKDGKIFAYKRDCEKYEAELEFEEKNFANRVHCFNSWGKEIKNYDPMTVDFIYIPEKEYEVSKRLLTIYHRNLNETSSSCLYYSYNMEIKPIEHLLGRKKQRVEEAQKDLERYEAIVKGILAKCK